eukprot:tig00000104_g4811.t1
MGTGAGARVGGRGRPSASICPTSAVVVGAARTGSSLFLCVAPVLLTPSLSSWAAAAAAAGGAPAPPGDVVTSIAPFVARYSTGTAARGRCNRPAASFEGVQSVPNLRRTTSGMGLGVIRRMCQGPAEAPSPPLARRRRPAAARGDPASELVQPSPSSSAAVPDATSRRRGALAARGLGVGSSSPLLLILSSSSSLRRAPWRARRATMAEMLWGPPSAPRAPPSRSPSSALLPSSEAAAAAAPAAAPGSPSPPPVPSDEDRPPALERGNRRLLEFAGGALEPGQRHARLLPVSGGAGVRGGAAHLALRLIAIVCIVAVRGVCWRRRAVLDDAVQTSPRSALGRLIAHQVVTTARIVRGGTATPSSGSWPAPAVDGARAGGRGAHLELLGDRTITAPCRFCGWGRRRRASGAARREAPHRRLVGERALLGAVWIRMLRIDMFHRPLSLRSVSPIFRC